MPAIIYSPTHPYLPLTEISEGGARTEIVMSHFFYKTTAAAVVAGCIAWTTKRADWDEQRKKLGEVFGGAASSMYSGTRSYVGGIKLSASRELDVHWCRPDQYGYRNLRSSAKHAKGTPKEDKAAANAEHLRLRALWNEHCPKPIDSEESWEALGFSRGALWMCGGQHFEFEGAVYMNLGLKLGEDNHSVDGAVEILASEYEAALQKFQGQKKAA
jgi:hypothetical protein